MDKAAFMKSEGVEPKPDAVIPPPEDLSDTHVMVSVDEPVQPVAKDETKADAKPEKSAKDDVDGVERDDDLGPDPLPTDKRDRGRPQKGYVKQEALWEARGREKAERERRIELERLLAERQTAPAQAQPEQPAGPPNPEDDIFAFLEWQKGETAKATAEVAQMRQQEQARAAQQMIMQAYVQDMTQFEGQHSDFRKALEHLAVSRRQELALMGYDDPNVQTQILNNEEMSIVQHAQTKGISPSEILYGLSRQRGYQPATPPQLPAGGASSNGSGAALDRIRNSQAQNMSLGSVPGGSVKQMTAKDIGAMSEEEQWKLMRSNPSAYKSIRAS